MPCPQIVRFARKTLSLRASRPPTSAYCAESVLVGIWKVHCASAFCPKNAFIESLKASDKRVLCRKCARWRQLSPRQARFVAYSFLLEAMYAVLGGEGICRERILGVISRRE